MEYIKIKKSELEYNGRIEYLFRDDAWFKKMLRISGLIPKDLDAMTKSIRSLNVTDSEGRRVGCWAFKHKDLIFYVWSANGRGTTVEFSGVPNNTIIKEFVEEFLKKLDGTAGIPRG